MGWTQKETANALLYKHRSTISQFENGHNEIPPKVEMLCKMFSERRTGNG